MIDYRYIEVMKDLIWQCRDQDELDSLGLRIQKDSENYKTDAETLKVVRHYWAEHRERIKRWDDVGIE